MEGLVALSVKVKEKQTLSLQVGSYVYLFNESNPEKMSSHPSLYIVILNTEH